jgi:hypothetical protein
MYFGTKSYLKSNRNHTATHTLKIKLLVFHIAFCPSGPTSISRDIKQNKTNFCLRKSGPKTKLKFNTDKVES